MNDPVPDLSLPEEVRARPQGDAYMAIAVLGWVCATSAILAYGRIVRSRPGGIEAIDAVLACLTVLLSGASVALLLRRRNSGRVLASITLAILGLNSIWVAANMKAYLLPGFYRPGTEVIALARAALFLALGAFVGYRAWNVPQTSKESSSSRGAA